MDTFHCLDILKGGGQGRVMNKKRSFLRARHGLADGVSCHGGYEKKGACGVLVKEGRRTQHAPYF
jgi:hypothetical protein